MKKYSEKIYWMTEKSWYIINEKNEFELTSAAPERARKSFEMWKKVDRLTLRGWFRKIRTKIF